MITYFVSYVADHQGKVTFGRATIEMDNPVKNISDIEGMEQAILQSTEVDAISILNFFQINKVAKARPTKQKRAKNR
jgi:hypothetical protein